MEMIKCDNRQVAYGAWGWQELCCVVVTRQQRVVRIEILSNWSYVDSCFGAFNFYLGSCCCLLLAPLGIIAVIVVTLLYRRIDFFSSFKYNGSLSYLVHFK